MGSSFNTPQQKKIPEIETLLLELLEKMDNI